MKDQHTDTRKEKSVQICFSQCKRKVSCKDYEKPQRDWVYKGTFPASRCTCVLAYQLPLFFSFLLFDRQYALVCSSSTAAWYRLYHSRTGLMPLLQVFLFTNAQGWWLSKSWFLQRAQSWCWNGRHFHGISGFLEGEMHSIRARYVQYFQSQ